MKVCIFGAASEHIDKIYKDEVEKLGEKLAKRGHSLVFGAGGTGLMGASARGFTKGGGYIHGVIPKFFDEFSVEVKYLKCDKITFTETMAERKSIMEDEADAFIITPGGVGTFEEFFEVLSLKQLGRHNKAIAVFDIADYFSALEKFMVEVRDKKFMNFKCYELYERFSDCDSVIDYIESYRADDTGWLKRKLSE